MKPNLWRLIENVLKKDLSASPEQITQTLFPSFSGDSKEFAAKLRLVKKSYPTYLRPTGWRRRVLWTSGDEPDPGFFMQLSVPEERGRKLIGGVGDPCGCSVFSNGTLQVQVYRRLWRGWLIQQLIKFDVPSENAKRHVMNLKSQSESSEIGLRIEPALKALKALAIHEPGLEVGLKVKSLNLALELSPKLAEVLQTSWDKKDDLLKKLMSPESSETVLASVSAFRIGKLFQGLGLNPQQIKQASDTLVTLGIEDQLPDFVYLVFGPRPSKIRQTGIRALTTPLANYEVRLSHP